MCSSSSSASPRNVEVRYTKFTIGGLPGEKHAVFVPDGLKLTLPVFAQICGAINREVPSMLLSGQGCLRHPARVSTRQLRECRAFRQLMEDARCSLGLAPGGAEEPACGFGCSASSQGQAVPSPQATELLPADAEGGGCLSDVADRVLEKKLASAVGSVAMAALRTNCWVLTGPQVSSFEVLLQQCAEAGEVGAFRLVMGHLQDRAYMEADASKMLLQQLFGASQAMSAQQVYRTPAVKLQGDLWNPQHNRSHPEFGRYGHDFWSFTTYEDRLSEGHPITQWPWPHGDLFILFYREEPALAASAAPPGVDWGYTTRARNDLEAVPLDPESLAPVAHVCVGGNEPGAKRRLLQTLKLMSPVIILDNTPSIPKQVGLLLNAIHRVWAPSPLPACKPFLAEGALTQLWGSPSSKELLQALSPSRLLQHVEQEFDCSGVDESERLGLSDIVGLLDLAQRRPQAFREVACVLDPLSGSADEAVARATALLSSRHGGCREVAGGTELHRSLVLKAWRLHRKLAQKAARLRSFASSLVLSIACTLLVSTALAVAAVSLSLQKADFEEINYRISAFVFHERLEVGYTWSEAARALNACLVVLPIAAGLLVLVQAHFRVSQRWTGVHLAASSVVSEIYHFLGAVGPYAGLPAVSQRLLLRRLQDSVRHLSLSSQEEGLLEGDGDLEDDFPRDSRALDEHVDEHLYGIAPPGWLRCRADACPSSVRSLAGGWTAEPKDLTAHLSAELYLEVRIVPLRRHYRNRARNLARARAALNTCFVLLLGAASGLGATGAFVWVPVPLGAAAFVLAAAHWFAPSEMLTAVTNALAVLSSLDLRWHGSDIRENRSDASKQRLIANTERIARVVAMVHTGCSAMSEGGGDEEEWSRDSPVGISRPEDERAPDVAAEGSW